jgi:putative transposase
MIISLYAGGMTVRDIQHHLDALVVKVRDGHQVRNKGAHIAVGVDLDGIKHVPGIWVQAAEGAKFWAGVCAELRNRGIRDVLIVCYGPAPR